MTLLALFLNIVFAMYEAFAVAVAVLAFWSITISNWSVSSLPSTNTLPDFQSIHWIEPVRSSVME